jgi:hypothetical protein
MKKWKRHRMNLTKPIHDLLKISESETVDQVPIAGVWPLRKIEQDRPFDGRINVAQCFLSHLDDSLMMKGEEGEKPVEWM